MEDFPEYIERAKILLENCKLSGASRELLERVVSEGFAGAEPGDDWGDAEEADERGLSERREIVSLCLANGLRLPS